MVIQKIAFGVTIEQILLSLIFWKLLYLYLEWNEMNTMFPRYYMLYETSSKTLLNK